MIVKQLYTKCLSQGSYYIESNGGVAIIDPLREVQQYIDMAESSNAKIKYIFETHFHADFVSGHLSLAERTQAQIIYGPNANPEFECHIARDNQEFIVGKIKLKVIHTPGHTLESTTYLLIDEQGKDHAIFTGDTLFLGEVGRPDLAQKSSMNENELAGILYDSLRKKIMPLSDELIVYPGHGAGSACGKKMNSETTGTLGEQKKSNYALRENMTKEEFISEVNEGLLPPPAYFPYNVSLNKTGYQNIEELIEKGINTLCPIEFEMTSELRNCVILDVRHQTEFAERHIPGSIFIGIDGSFAPWVGSVLKDINQPILLVANEERIEETVIRLSRVGFDNVVGVLCNDLDDWVNSGRDIESVNSESPSDWVEAFENSEVNVIDVRNESEHQSEHILNSINIPLNELTDRIDEIDFSKKTLIHCAGGYRSMIACSLLKYKGHHDLIDIKGGYATIKETKFPKSNFSCPSTLTN